MEKTRRRKSEKKEAKQMNQTKGSGDRSNGEVVVRLVNGELDFHTIVVDCSSIPFMDSAGSATFTELVKDYEEVGVRVLLACCNTSLIESLQMGKFFGEDDKDMSSRMFHTVHSAVLQANRMFEAGGRRSGDV